LSASRKQLEEARKALESARADVQTRAKELADARAQIRKQTDEAAAERGRLEERVRLFEESRNDLRREVEHLREAGVAKAAEMAGQADAVALQEQNATLQRHLEERFHEVCVLTHVIEDLERALQDKNNVAAAEAKARNEIAALKAENQQLIDRLGGCQVENQQLADRLGGSVVESRELSERLEDCQGERDAQLARVQDLLSSRSWRVTSPLRVSMNLFRAMFRS
jgi:chromosome segregation ATPase